MKYIILLSLFLSSTSFAFEMTTKGQIDLELRQFKSDNDQNTLDNNTSVKAQLEAKLTGKYLNTQFRGFSRVDTKDKERQLFNIEELFVSKSFESINTSVSLGNKIYTWSILEIFHPIDFVHSRNFDSNIESLEKFGETTAQINFGFDNYSLQLFYMPLFKSPKQPTERSRLSIGSVLADPIVVNGDSKFEDKSAYLQGGARFTGSLDNSEFSLFLFSHIDRDTPIIGTKDYAIVLGTPVPLALPNTPYYHRAIKAGFSYQYNFDELIFKSEMLHKSFPNKPEILTVNGIQSLKDQTLTSIGLEFQKSHDSGADSTFFVEFQYEISKGDSVNMFQNDLAIGQRYTFNDIAGSELTYTLLLDLDKTSEFLVNIAYSRRLGPSWKLKINGRYITAPPEGTPSGLEFLDENHELSFTLIRYF